MRAIFQVFIVILATQVGCGSSEPPPDPNVIPQSDSDARPSETPTEQTQSNAPAQPTKSPHKFIETPVEKAKQQQPPEQAPLTLRPLSITVGEGTADIVYVKTGQKKRRSGYVRKGQLHYKRIDGNRQVKAQGQIALPPDVKFYRPSFLRTKNDHAVVWATMSKEKGPGFSVAWYSHDWQFRKVTPIKISVESPRNNYAVSTDGDSVLLLFEHTQVDTPEIKADGYADRKQCYQIHRVSPDGSAKLLDEGGKLSREFERLMFQGPIPVSDGKILFSVGYPENSGPDHCIHLIDPTGQSKGKYLKNICLLSIYNGQNGIGPIVSNGKKQFVSVVGTDVGYRVAVIRNGKVLSKKVWPGKDAWNNPEKRYPAIQDQEQTCQKGIPTTILTTEDKGRHMFRADTSYTIFPFSRIDESRPHSVPQTGQWTGSFVIRLADTFRERGIFIGSCKEGAFEETEFSL